MTIGKHVLSSARLAARDRLIVALDVSTLDEASALIEELAGEVGMFKFGLELFSSCGTALFELAERSGIKIFFDGKFHDIPNTVAQASRAITRQKVAMFNLHATGGSAMMQAAAAAVKQTASELIQPPALIAVTILTSMKAETLASEIKVSLPLEQMVLHLAKMAQDAGLDGVVASAKEASAIRQACGPDFLIVTPGIRPSWAASDDQARIVTPKDAIAGGADYIVVGRPIVRAENRVEAARRIVAELAQS
jgi:orotidine-5'-phosphate decarboxylase